MDLENELKKSYYHNIANIDERHNVKLVQHTENGKIYVFKTLSVFDSSVYEFMKANPIKGVPEVYDLIRDGDQLHVVEEYITGDTLQEVINRNEPLDYRAILDILDQLCVILLPLHQHQPPIVHRDIKPSNLILSTNGALTLVDFNTAKVCDSSKKQDTVLLGTVGYAAPEQYGFSVSQPTADIYAIGVLAHSLAAVGRQEGDVRTGPLGKMIAKCTRMDPKQRYPSTGELQKTIRQISYKLSQPVSTDWLPPGLRNRKPLWMVLSLLGYLFLIYLCLTLQVNSLSHAEVFFNRLACFTLFFSLILLWGNYHQIWRRLPLVRSSRLPRRVVGLLIGSVLIAVVDLTCMSLLIRIFS